MITSALKWVGDTDGFLELIDQRRLPSDVVMLKCRNIEQLFDAIKSLAVRGAPAIGVAGAYGLVLSIQKLNNSSDLKMAFAALNKARERLASSRPTAVNLVWAMDRVVKKVERFAADKPATDLQTLKDIVLNEANSIFQEDAAMCLRIGENGQKFIKQGDSILTHCNAGALATAGRGTALSIMFEAHEKGKKFRVYADETRPLLQGSRLTAWELKQAGIDVTIICDNMAGWLMKQGKINTVFTGADRIAANGDAANKIGTYSVAVLAKKHNIPFHIAAPSSTFDLGIKNGSQIPIEQRPAQEVTCLGDKIIAPKGVDVYNPAFDVTEAALITAIITEKGVIENPDTDSISEHLRQ
ncbi:MAG: S-methyl-5-thioribose-1-phosphate isomerase [Planctomycetota bacterium]|nr:S-methyl-5-thioribose-1-phosphate isomerase [Planctomycetota bacterium]